MHCIYKNRIWLSDSYLFTFFILSTSCILFIFGYCSSCVFGSKAVNEMLILKTRVQHTEKKLSIFSILMLNWYYNISNKSDRKTMYISYCGHDFFLFSTL